MAFPQKRAGRENQSFSQDLYGQLNGHRGHKHIVGYLKLWVGHHAKVRGFEQLWDCGKGGDYNHDPVEVGDKAEKFMEGTETDFALFA
mgnify:CR=1 FL=1